MSSGILLQASRRQTMGLLSIAPVPAQGICLYLEQWSNSDVGEEKLSMPYSMTDSINIDFVNLILDINLQRFNTLMRKV